MWPLVEGLPPIAESLLGRGLDGFFPLPETLSGVRAGTMRNNPRNYPRSWVSLACGPGVCSAWRRRLRARGEAVAEPPVTFAGSAAEAAHRGPADAGGAGRGGGGEPAVDQRPGARHRRDAAAGHGPAAGRRAGPDRPGQGGVRGGRAGPCGPCCYRSRRHQRRGGHPDAASRHRLVHRAAAGTAGAGDATAGAAQSGGVVSIHAIGGMAGVGKTAFAVHAAHRLADRFPGGQIFLPLHGHTPGQQPVDPADALASLLLTAGVPAAQIPPGLEARMALWRDRLAERQLLLVLDDAASSEQVRPLLPGAGGSLVLVTSRRHLSALEDATAVSLDTLPPERGGRAAGPAGGPGRAEPGRSGGGRDHPAVRVPAAGDRDGGPPAAPSPGLDGGRAGRRAGRGAGPAGADGDREPVGGRRVRPVVRRPAPRTSSGCSAGWGCTPAPTSTATPPPPWTAPTWRRPAAAWRRCTTSTC